MDMLAPTPDSAAGCKTSPQAALEAFCHQVSDVVDNVPECEVPARIASLLGPLLAIPDLLSPAQRALPPEGYGRHDVFICPTAKFSVLAAVWPAGIVSPIHDHKTWCALGVYHGVIEETRYEPASSGAATDAVAVSVATLKAGDVAHLPVDAPDIHAMHNPTGEAAISIHVYAGDAAAMGPNVETVYSAEA